MFEKYIIDEETTLTDVRLARFEDLISVCNEDGEETHLVVIFRIVDIDKLWAYKCKTCDDPTSKYGQFKNMMFDAVGRKNFDRDRLQGSTFLLKIHSIPLLYGDDVVDMIDEIADVTLSRFGPNF